MHNARPQSWRDELPGLALLLLATAFTAWFAAPELRINQLAVNDITFHLAASERLNESFTNHEPFLDPWVSEWALGYPVWFSYQPLPHLAAAVVFRLFHNFASDAALFAALYYFLLISFPASVYLGARLLGLSPPAAGLASVLVYAPSATGLPAGYGIGYGALVWRGTGLYTQLFALHLLVISLGITARALDRSTRRLRILAAVFLALTSLSHIIFGYVAFVSAGLLTVFGPVGPAKARRQRLLRLPMIAIPALLLILWFLVPLFLYRGVINHSRWEDPQKWDSYGASFILRQLFSGAFWDYGRLPVMSMLIAIGAGVAAVRRRNPPATRLIALTGFWLLLFFGRTTWGGLVMLFGVPADLHMHRLQAAFELCAILLGCYGLCEAAKWLRVTNWYYAAGLWAAVGMCVTVAAVDRANYLNQDAAWGDANLALWAGERNDIEATLGDVRSILARRPGRVSSGTGSNQVKIGWMQFFMLLTREHMDETSFLYHAMSKSADPMPARNPYSAANDEVYGIRAVIAGADQPEPPYLMRRGVHGRFAVYESSPEGYFGVVRIGGHYTGPESGEYDMTVGWLQSGMPAEGEAISLDPRDTSGPSEVEAGPFRHSRMAPPGRVLSESKMLEVYRARVEMTAPAYAYVKITWNPKLVAMVDGKPAELIRVTPGFGAVAVGSGQHDIEVSYQPGPLRAMLFLLGIAGAGLVWLGWGTEPGSCDADLLDAQL